jgi:hypothetical protein
VLAVLGTVTFWQPSQSLVLLWLLAIPLAALGAWLAAARLTNRATLRAFGALAYALAPTLLVALQGGRPSAVLAHILLPWLFFAGLAARRSWAASATTALLAAATVACAPILIPALVIAWIAAIVFAGRRAARIVLIPLPAVVLFAPLVWQQATRGAWLSVLADPGVPVDARQTPAWQLALGFPDGVLGGWHQVATSLMLPTTAANIVVPILLAPLGILAILALFLRGTVRAIIALLVALTGFLTAVAALHLQLAVTGGTVVPIWPGSALSLYWIGLVGAAVLALSALGRAAVYPAWVAIVTLAVVIVPVGIASLNGTAVVAESDGRTMPAVVTAKAATQPRVGTLRIVPQPDGGIRADLVRGSGSTLDGQSTLADTERRLTAGQEDLAQLAGNLASRSGYDATTQLKKLGVDFVLLAPSETALGEADASAAEATRSRAAVAMDANPVLSSVGTTASGRLWAFDSGTSEVPAAARIPADAGGIWRLVVLLVQGIVIGVTLLIAIPTSRSADRVSELSARRPHRRKDDELAVEPDDEPDEPDVAADGVADESVDEYVVEPEDEAVVESADLPEPAPAGEAAPAAEPAPAGEQAPSGEPDAVGERRDAAPVTEPQPAPEHEPAPQPSPTNEDDHPVEREAERVTTPPAPTTLEDGLEETIIRPRRSFDGGDRG